MRILIAGASGAIGRPLIRRLRANQHVIFALTRPDSTRLKEIDAEPVVADALEINGTNSSASPAPGTYQYPELWSR